MNNYKEPATSSSEERIEVTRVLTPSQENSSDFDFPFQPETSADKQGSNFVPNSIQGSQIQPSMEHFNLNVQDIHHSRSTSDLNSSYVKRLSSSQTAIQGPKINSSQTNYGKEDGIVLSQSYPHAFYQRTGKKSITEMNTLHSHDTQFSNHNVQLSQSNVTFSKSYHQPNLFQTLKKNFISNGNELLESQYEGDFREATNNNIDKTESQSLSKSTLSERFGSNLKSTENFNHNHNFSRMNSAELGNKMSPPNNTSQRFDMKLKSDKMESQIRNISQDNETMHCFNKTNRHFSEFYPEELAMNQRCETNSMCFEDESNEEGENFVEPSREAYYDNVDESTFSQGHLSQRFERMPLMKYNLQEEENISSSQIEQNHLSYSNHIPANISQSFSQFKDVHSQITSREVLMHNDLRNEVLFKKVPGNKKGTNPRKKEILSTNYYGKNMELDSTIDTAENLMINNKADYLNIGHSYSQKCQAKNNLTNRYQDFSLDRNNFEHLDLETLKKEGSNKSATNYYESEWHESPNSTSDYMQWSRSQPVSSHSSNIKSMTFQTPFNNSMEFHSNVPTHGNNNPHLINLNLNNRLKDDDMICNRNLNLKIICTPNKVRQIIIPQPYNIIKEEFVNKPVCLPFRGNIRDLSNPHKLYDSQSYVDKKDVMSYSENKSYFDSSASCVEEPIYTPDTLECNQLQQGINYSNNRLNNYSEGIFGYASQQNKSGLPLVSQNNNSNVTDRCKESFNCGPVLQNSNVQNKITDTHNGLGSALSQGQRVSSLKCSKAETNTQLSNKVTSQVLSQAVNKKCSKNSDYLNRLLKKPNETENTVACKDFTNEIATQQENKKYDLKDLDNYHNKVILNENLITSTLDKDAEPVDESKDCCLTIDDIFEDNDDFVNSSCDSVHEFDDAAIALQVKRDKMSEKKDNVLLFSKEIPFNSNLTNEKSATNEEDKNGNKHLFPLEPIISDDTICPKQPNKICSNKPIFLDNSELLKEYSKVFKETDSNSRASKYSIS